MKSIISLPPVLQAVWTAVYAAGVNGELSRYSIDSATSTPSDESIAAWAENHAWEAVRRANGGEMPEEHEREEGKRTVVETRPADEPTDEEMIVALAPLAAEVCQALHASPDAQQRIVEACGASWKAARAWWRK